MVYSGVIQDTSSSHQVTRRTKKKLAINCDFAEMHVGIFYIVFEETTSLKKKKRDTMMKCCDSSVSGR